MPTLCALALLAGCGDDDEPKRTVTVPGGDEIRVKADEYSFDPGRVVVDGARPRIRLRLENAGSLAHNIHVLDGERDLGGVPSFSAGESRSASVAVPPGSYRLVCTVGDHEELGMTGELEVKR